MRDVVRELCVLSVFCGAAVSLCPEGGGKRVLQILESLVLLAVILNGVGKLDLAPYTTELARLHEREAELLQDSEVFRNKLDRLVIEEEYRTYLEKRADELGASLSEVQIRARWSMDGLWVPDSSRIQMCDARFRDALEVVLSGELGIPKDRQEWIIDA